MAVRFWQADNGAISARLMVERSRSHTRQLVRLASHVIRLQSIAFAGVHKVDKCAAQLDGLYRTGKPSASNANYMNDSTAMS